MLPVQYKIFTGLFSVVDATDGQSSQTDWGQSFSNKYFNKAPTHFTHYTLFSQVTWVDFETWVSAQWHTNCGWQIWLSQKPYLYIANFPITRKLFNFRHFAVSVGVLSGWALKYNPNPWGAQRGVTGEPYQSCELAWKDTACVQSWTICPW